MPALPDVPSVLRIQLTGTKGANPWLTRFFLQYGGTAPTNTQLATFNAALLTTYNTNIKPLADNVTALLQIQTQDLTSPTAAVSVSAVSSTGTRGATGLTSESAVVVSYKIGRRYRGGHSRGYWPWGVQGDTATEHSWLAASVTAFGTGYAAFQTALAAAGWAGAGTIAQVGVSYYQGFTNVAGPTGRMRPKSTIRGGGPVVDAVTSIQVQSFIGSQRRRIGFVG